MTLLAEVLARPSPRLRRDAPDTLRRLRWAAPRTRAFVFDEGASERSGRFARECTDVVVENAVFAIPPYPECYLELDHLAMLRGGTIPPAGEGRRLGFLVLDDGRRVHSLAGDGRDAYLSPLVYVRRDAGPSALRRGMAPESYETFLKVLVAGETALGRDFMRGPELAAFVEMWDVDLAYPVPEVDFRRLVHDHAGDVKHALSALLLLNQRRVCRTAPAAAGSRIVRGRRVAYAAHSTVTLSLDAPRDVRRTFEAGDRASPRRHEVRGHFVHFDVVDGCAHGWTDHDAGDGRRRWRCVACGGRRTWRDAFLRGDAGIGFATKDYEVVARDAGPRR